MQTATLERTIAFRIPADVAAELDALEARFRSEIGTLVRLRRSDVARRVFEAGVAALKSGGGASPKRRR